MKKIKALVLLLGILLMMAGCGSFKAADANLVSHPLNVIGDDTFNDDFNNVSAGYSVIKPNVTKEQMDEMFCHVEIWGNNFTLPLKESDLPENFSLELDLGMKDKAYRYNTGHLEYKDDNGYMVSDLVGFVEAGDGERIIVAVNSILLASEVCTSIDGLTVGLDASAFVEKYGPGEVRTSKNDTFTRRYYTDGERALWIMYNNNALRGVEDEDKIAEILDKTYPIAVYASCWKKAYAVD